MPQIPLIVPTFSLPSAEETSYFPLIYLIKNFVKIISPDKNSTYILPLIFILCNKIILRFFD